MRITVINDDNTLGLDGVFYHNLDFSTVPDNVHALQWDGTKGEIEFYADEDGEKPANQKITELPDWVMPLKTQWDAAAALRKQQEEAFAQTVAQAEAVDLEIQKAAAEKNIVQTP